MSATTTPIADLVESLLASGTAHDVIVLAVKAAEVASRSKRSASSSRGTRLSADWRPSEADIAFARDRGMPAARIQNEAERFKNYWSAKSGAGATKTDWSATWRNWILKAMEGLNVYSNRNTGALPASGCAQTGGNAVLAGMVRLADSRREARGAAGPDHREVAARPNVARINGTLFDASR